MYVDIVYDLYVCIVAEVAEAADDVRNELLTPDSGCEYDQLIEINLDQVRAVVIWLFAGQLWLCNLSVADWICLDLMHN